MVQKLQVLLEDDLTGGTADETVRFGLDGTTYEIDLNSKNADKLRKAFAPFVDAARKTTAAGRRGRRGSARVRDRDQTQEIRAWAREKGYKVNERGRIPARIVEEFQAAHPRS